jgi:hypothetical protein
MTSRIKSHKYTAHFAVSNFSLPEVRNNAFALKKYYKAIWGGPGVVGPETYTIFGTVLKKKNTKLRIQS